MIRGKLQVFGRLAVALALIGAAGAGGTAEQEATETSAKEAAESREWRSLFNGETLDGWVVQCKPEDADKTYWQAEDGMIICDTKDDSSHDYVWLMTKEEFDDFDLILEVQSYASSNGNSGVQVRSRYDGEAQWLDGPQIDIHPPTPWRTGHVYDETRGTRRWIFPSLPDSGIKPEQVDTGHVWRHSTEGNGWNTLRIRCEGPRIQTYVNGTPVADYDGSGLLDDEAHRRYQVGMSGHIALQLHIRDDLKIAFRNIRIRKL